MNESITKYLSRIKDLRDNMGDIGEEMSSSDLVTITFKGLFPYYKVFISALATRQIPLTFVELSGILLQEEERMKIYELESQTTDQALMERVKQAHRGNQWNRHRGKFHTRHRGMSHTNSNVNRNVECHYYGKSGHIARDCFRKNNHESNHRYRKHNEIM